MTPKSREREYARRRYSDWQKKQAVKMERRRRQRQTAIIAGVAAAAVLVVVGTVLIVNRSKDDQAPAAVATTSPSASVSPSASASADASTSADASQSPSASAAAGPNPCPAPTVKPPATPQSFPAAPDAALAGGKSWKLALTTTCGAIEAQLFGDKAPKAVSNAIFLSGKKFWDGSPCHRLVTEGIYVLQCGDPTGTGSGGPGYSFGPVENAPADQKYQAGTLAMARTQDPNGNGSQFFIVYKETSLPGGYTIFGKITKGLDIVQKVADGGSDNSNGSGDGKPNRPVSLVSTAVSAA